MADFTLKVEVACLTCHTVIGVHVSPFESGNTLSMNDPLMHQCVDGVYQLSATGTGSAYKIEKDTW